MNRKNVLLISHAFTIDGAPSSLLSVAKVLAVDNSISVWSLKDGPMANIYKEELQVIPTIIDINNIKVIKKELVKYDFIYINTIVTYKFAKLCEELRLPYMWVIREASNIPEICKNFKININDLSSTIKKCNKSTYTISEYAKDYIDKTFDVNLPIIKNFIEDCYQKEPDFNNQNIVFTIMGCHEARKGVDILIEAICEQKHPCILNICGNTNTKYAQNLINKTQNNKNIIWHGIICGEFREKIFDKTDIFVVPSLDESCSRVVLEAMMFGKPVIATENVGAKYLIKSNTGWIVKSGDIKSLSKCINKILSNKYPLQKMGKAARKMYLNTSTPEIYSKNLQKIMTDKLKKYPLKFDTIFSIKNRESSNQNWYKVITILGIKIKLKNKTLTKIKKLERIELTLANSDKAESKKNQYIKDSLSKLDEKIFLEKDRLQYELYKYLPPEKYADALKDWYFYKTGNILNLANPQSYNEKIQWLKLYDSTPIKTQLADKYLVREWIKERIGEVYLIPLLGVYDKFEEIDFAKLPNQFVIKCNHGSGYNIIVKDKTKLNKKDTRNKINTWLNEDFAFKEGFEMHYSKIPRKIIIEEYISPESSNIEIQSWCFNGKIEFISYESCKTEEKPSRAIFSPEWEPKNFSISPDKYSKFPKLPEKPTYLEELIKIVTILAKGFKHVRIDFIIVENKLLFREMTFTSGSGLSSFEPSNVSLDIGKLINIKE